jgi:uncharacterized protein (TIGR03435 family)
MAMGFSKIHLMAAAGAVLLAGGMALYFRPGPGQAPPPSATDQPGGGEPRSASPSVGDLSRAGAVAASPATGTPPASEPSKEDAARDLIDQMNPGALRGAEPLVYVARAEGGPGRHASIAVNGKFMGRAVSAPELLATAYGTSRSRIRVGEGVRLPEGRFDYLVTLESGQKEALQERIRELFGLVARTDTRAEEVFVMTARTGEFQNRRPSEDQGGRMRVRNDGGELNLENVPIRTLVGNLEQLLGTPVVDESGLRGRFDIQFTLEPANENDNRPGAENVMKAVSEQLGLELQKEKREMEVLLVERAEKR